MKKIYRIMILSEYEIEHSKEVGRKIIQVINTCRVAGVKCYRCLVLWYPAKKGNAYAI